MAEEVKVYDWDDEISDDGNGSFVTLDEGNYDFEVTKFERGHYTPSANSKTPACNQANITIKISTKDGDAYIVDKFPLASTMEWKASAFFRSIGLKKHGEPLKMRWTETIGCKGRAYITKTKGEKQDVYFNNVKNYLDPVKVDDEWS
jgi:hypothetical protein